MKKLKAIILFGATLSIGVVSAARWIFPSGTELLKTEVSGAIDNEWTFLAAKALLVENGSDEVIYLVYDSVDYEPGDSFNEMNIVGVDSNFDRTFDETGEGEHGFFYDEGVSKVVVDISFQDYYPTSLDAWFDSCADLSEIENISFINTSSVTSMAGVFNNCESFVDINLSCWDTSLVKDMSYMFNNCNNVTEIDLSNWITSSVKDTSYMFNNCYNVRSIYATNGCWTSYGITNGTNMFNQCNMLMGGVGTQFDSSIINTTRAKIDTLSSNGYLTEIYQPRALLIGKTVHLISGKGNFRVGESYNGETIDDITYKFSGFSMAGSSAYSGFFKSESPTKIIIDESFYDYKPYDMKYWFYNMDKVETIEGLENIDTSNISSFVCLFRGCKSLKSADISMWDTTLVTDFASLFFDCYDLTTANVSNIVTQRATRITSMFNGCHSLVSVDFSNWDTSNVTQMSLLFANCYLITSLDLSSFDTSSVIRFDQMFMNCSSLTYVNVNSFDLSSLDLQMTFTGDYFKGCSSLTTLDLSSWDTTNMKSTENMFKDCSNLTTIYVDPLLWNMSNVTNSANMFSGCVSLIGGNGTIFRTYYTDKSYANVDGYNGQVGYLTDINQKQ